MSIIRTLTTSTLLVNSLFHLGAMYLLKFALFDVTAAFLEGKNDFVQYACLPFDCMVKMHRKVWV